MYKFCWIVLNSKVFERIVFINFAFLRYRYSRFYFNFKKLFIFYVNLNIYYLKYPLTKFIRLSKF